jgi:hypothetical protein
MLMTRKSRLGAEKPPYNCVYCLHDETSAGGSTCAVEGQPRGRAFLLYDLTGDYGVVTETAVLVAVIVIGTLNVALPASRPDSYRAGRGWDSS